MLTAETRTRDAAEPSGEPDSLWGRMKGKMGDRVHYNQPEELVDRKAKAKKKCGPAGTCAKPCCCVHELVLALAVSTASSFVAYARVWSHLHPRRKQATMRRNTSACSSHSPPIAHTLPVQHLRPFKGQPVFTAEPAHPRSRRSASVLLPRRRRESREDVEAALPRKRRTAAVGASVLDLDAAGFYKPLTRQTRDAYEALLDTIQVPGSTSDQTACWLPVPLITSEQLSRSDQRDVLRCKSRKYAPDRALCCLTAESRAAVRCSFPFVQDQRRHEYSRRRCSATSPTTCCAAQRTRSSPSSRTRT